MCSNLTEATVSNKEEKLIRKRRKVVDPTPRSWKRQAFISTRKCCKQANATIGVRNWKPYIGDDSMDEGLRIWQQLTRRRTTTAAPSRTTTATSSPCRAWREGGRRRPHLRRVGPGERQGSEGGKRGQGRRARKEGGGAARLNHGSNGCVTSSLRAGSRGRTSPEQHRRRMEPGRGWTEAARRREAKESRGGWRGRRRAGAGVRHGRRGGSWEGGANEGGPARLLPSRAELCRRDPPSSRAAEQEDESRCRRQDPSSSSPESSSATGKIRRTPDRRARAPPPRSAELHSGGKQGGGGRVGSAPGRRGCRWRRSRGGGAAGLG